jgi:RNA polymerase sigma-70 factor (ECF subfamily)
MRGDLRASASVVFMRNRPSPHSSGTEDAQWIATILQGRSALEREECYANLFRKYWKLVMVLVGAKVGDRREAEDITQEAFVRAFRSLDKLSHPVAFLGWLLQITRNLVTDHIRSRKAHVSLDLLGMAADPRVAERPGLAPDFQESLEVAEEIQEALGAMEELPERYREVVALRYLQGLSGKEMSELLGEPEGTVRNRLFRALEKLRENLQLRRAQRP